MNVTATIPRILLRAIETGQYRCERAWEFPVIGEMVQLKWLEGLYWMSRDLYESILQNQVYVQLSPNWAYIDYNCLDCYPRLSEIEKLYLELEAAIHEEDYERAAKYRDLINQS